MHKHLRNLFFCIYCHEIQGNSPSDREFCTFQPKKSSDPELERKKYSQAFLYLNNLYNNLNNFKMISLSDEIDKFKKMVYNPELQQFITVDQNFVGGGITMQSMVQENSFMVSQIKKLNTVFRNYCLLNEKVYNKIMEHEINIHEEKSKLNSLVTVVDRKMTESILIIKDLHQSTTNQNFKTKEILKEKIDPLRQEIEKKVDTQTFAIKMKKILQELQENDEQQYKQGGQQGGLINQQGELVQPQSPRKKGKVNYSQFYKLKDDLEQKLKKEEQINEQIGKDLKNTQNLLMKYIPVISKSELSINQQTEDINNVIVQQQTLKLETKSNFNKITTQLEEKTNDKILFQKLLEFKKAEITPYLNSISSQMKKQFSEINEKTISQKNSQTKKNLQFEMKINQQKIKLEEISQKFPSIKKQIKSVKQQFQAFKNIQEGQNYELDKKIQQKTKELSNGLKQFQEKIQKELQDLAQQIDNLTIAIEQIVMKNVLKKFENMLKNIDKQIAEIREKTKITYNQLIVAFQQIKFMKDILAKKANYSDIVMHVERKADKQDIKDLEHKVRESSNNIKSNNFLSQRNIQESTVDKVNKHQKLDISSARRKTSLISKTNYHTPNINIKDLNTSKLYMCGFDNNSPENRVIFTQNTRRKSLKSAKASIQQYEYF